MRLEVALGPTARRDLCSDADSTTSRSARCQTAGLVQKPIPKFNSEEEEANWWDVHSDEHDEWMLEAIRAGETTTLDAVLKRDRERSRNALAYSIGIDPGDVARAQSIAAKKGLDYEAYLKTLVHEALIRDEERLAS